MKSFLLVYAAVLCISAAQSAAQSPLRIGGYTELYYSYNSAPPAHGDRPMAFNHARHNEFAVNIALVDVRYETETMRARVALHTGTYAAANYSAEPVLMQLLHEARAGFALDSTLWIDAGVLSSHVGAESAIGRDNYTLTRSLAAEYSPYYETGIRAEWLASAQWTVRLLLLNGWQNIRETNSSKAFGSQVQYAPSSALLLNWSTFVGNEAPDSTQSATRVLSDIYALWTLNESLSMLALADIGTQRTPAGDQALWYTTTLVARYKLLPELAVALRGEYCSDAKHIVLPAATIASASLNLDWQPTANVIARIETRWYSVDNSIWTIPTGIHDTNGTITTSLGFTF